MSVRLYEVRSDEFVTADNAGWLPGVYADREAARIAGAYAETSLSARESLTSLRDRINHHDGENRPITVDDLAAAGIKP